MFVITKDFGSKVEIVGPGNATLTADQILNHLEAQKFRMLDDDGEVDYYGYFLGEDEFEPLDCYGLPNAGCTSIQYRRDGSWKAL